MKNIIVKINDAVQTVQEVAVVTNDGQPTVIKGVKNVNYQLVDQATGRGPDHIVTKRVGKDLHISLEDAGEETDLIIEGFYEDDRNALIGQAEDGQYYYYIPDTGEVADYVTQLQAGDVEGQALGGSPYATPWWIGATDTGFGYLPWILGLIGVGALAAALADDDDDKSTPKTATPTIGTITSDDSDGDGVADKTIIPGTAEPGSTVTLTLPDGSTQTTKADNDGKYTFEVDKPVTDTDIKITAKTDGKETSDPATATIDVTPPKAPDVVAQPDGSVTSTPASDAVKSEVEYTDEDGETQTITATKTDTDGDGTPDTWVATDKDGNELPTKEDPNNPAQPYIDPKTGVITIPEEAVKDGSTVTGTNTDAAGNESEPDTATTLPSGPAVNPQDDGSVVVDPEGLTDTKTQYTDENGETQTITATKGDHDNDPTTPDTWVATDKDGNQLPTQADPEKPAQPYINPETGVITIPNEAVKNGTDVTSVGTDKDGNPVTEQNSATSNDTVPPTVQTIEVPADGKTVVLTYDEPLDPNNPPKAEDFKVTVGDKEVTPTEVKVEGNKVTLTLPEPVKQGETVTVSYTDPTTGNDTKATQDQAGNDAESLTNKPVKNSSTYQDPDAPQLLNEEPTVYDDIDVNNKQFANPDDYQPIVDGTVTNDNKPSIIVPKEDADKGNVELVIDGKVVPSTSSKDSEGNTVLTPVKELPDGEHTIGYKVTDPDTNKSSNSQTVDFTVDTTPPNADTTKIEVNPIATDDIINAKEEGETTLPVSGTVKGEFTEGDKVTVTVNGKDYTTTVKADGTFTVDVDTADLVADPDTVADVKVSATDKAGNVGEVTTTKDYSVDTGVPGGDTDKDGVGDDTSDPKTDVTLPDGKTEARNTDGAPNIVFGEDKVDPNTGKKDDILNADEIGDDNSTPAYITTPDGSETGDLMLVKVNDVPVDRDGNPVTDPDYKGFPLTETDITKGYVEVPVKTVDANDDPVAEIKVTAQVTDAAGNSSAEGTKTAKVDTGTTPPEVTPSTTDGSVTVAPTAPDQVKLVAKYDDESDPTQEQTITATKGDHDNDPTTPDTWSATDKGGNQLPTQADPNNPAQPWIDPEKGIITIPQDAVKDGTPVKAEVTDEAGNTASNNATLDADKAGTDKDLVVEPPVASISVASSTGLTQNIANAANDGVVAVPAIVEDGDTSTKLTYTVTLDKAATEDITLVVKLSGDTTPDDFDLVPNDANTAVYNPADNTVTVKIAKGQTSASFDFSAVKEPDANTQFVFEGNEKLIATLQADTATTPTYKLNNDATKQVATGIIFDGNPISIAALSADVTPHYSFDANQPKVQPSAVVDGSNGTQPVTTSNFNDNLFVGYYPDGSRTTSLGNLSGHVIDGYQGVPMGRYTDADAKWTTVDLAGGDDTFKLRGNVFAYTSTYLGEGNDDFLIYANTDMAFSVADAGKIFAEAGDDRVVIREKAMQGLVYMGQGSDTFVLGTTDDLGQTGSDGALIDPTKTYADGIVRNSGNLSGLLDLGTGLEAQDEKFLTKYQGGYAINESLGVASTDTAADINTVNINGNVSGTIQGDVGQDNITVLGNVSGTINTGFNTANATAIGADNITVNGNVTGTITTGDVADVVTVGGLNDANINLGAGDDKLIYKGSQNNLGQSELGGVINGGEGYDVLDFSQATGTGMLDYTGFKGFEEVVLGNNYNSGNTSGLRITGQDLLDDGVTGIVKIEGVAGGRVDLGASRSDAMLGSGTPNDLGGFRGVDQDNGYTLWTHTNGEQLLIDNNITVI